MCGGGRWRALFALVALAMSQRIVAQTEQDMQMQHTL
jgi:hypothetical protein